jgi:hypothetical protein
LPAIERVIRGERADVVALLEANDPQAVAAFAGRLG